MRHNIIYFLFFLFLNISCEEEIPKKEFPVMITLNPIENDSSGVTFMGEVLEEGLIETGSYGFVWSPQEPLVGVTSQIDVGTNAQKGTYQIRIDTLLSKGFSYNVRAFATFNENVVYGNTITFISEGCPKTNWSKAAPIEFFRYGTPYGCSNNTFGYVLFPGGNVFSYDPNNNQFAELPNFPEKGHTGTRFSAVHKDSTFYVFNNLNRNLYQFENNVWSVHTTTPFKYSYFGGYYHCYLFSDIIYLLSTTQSYSYDLDADIWTEKSICPRGSGNYSVAGTDLNGKAYVMINNKVIMEYNPITDDWIEKTIYPGAFVSNFVAFSHGHKIYFGFSATTDINGNLLSPYIWSYDVNTDRWDKVEPLPTLIENRGIFHFQIKDKVYFGLNSSGDYNLFALNLSNF